MTPDQLDPSRRDASDPLTADDALLVISTLAALGATIPAPLGTTVFIPTGHIDTARQPGPGLDFNGNMLHLGAHATYDGALAALARAAIAWIDRNPATADITRPWDPQPSPRNNLGGHQTLPAYPNHPNPYNNRITPQHIPTPPAPRHQPAAERMARERARYLQTHTDTEIITAILGRKGLNWYITELTVET